MEDIAPQGNAAQTPDLETEFDFIDESEMSNISDIVDLNQLRAKQKINQHLCGILEKIDEGYAKTRFTASDEMIADRKGLVHTGFIFSAADFAAMAAVNEPYAVLAVAKANFLGPMEVGDEAIFEATVQQLTTRKRNVSVVGMLYDVKFFEAEFTAVILERHILGMHLVS